MPKYEIIVTDVTNYGTLFCVAGWNNATAAMIRPEPATTNPNYEATRFWHDNYVGPDKPFWPGNVVSFDAALPPASFAFPHATEDRLVESEPMLVGSIKLGELGKLLENTVSTTLPMAYDGALSRAASGKAFVLHNQKVRSLGGLVLPPGSIFMRTDVNSYSGKRTLRATVLSSNVKYDLSVTSDALRTYWRQYGVEALRTALGPQNAFHVRVGLSRPFPDQPDKMLRADQWSLPAIGLDRRHQCHGIQSIRSDTRTCQFKTL